ncbi:MAG: selenide, water dikinase SelD [Acidobacteria bacterium]|nr:selenide, water dikinase SelD [Acidobacteriota bacterium]
MDPIKLTQTVKKGGCAAKLPAQSLRGVLDGLTMHRPTQLAVGSQSMDDAALWDLGDGRFLIQTLDFFTPIVEDPFEFGQIAAANALSDIYAMGGQPSTALTILGFPAASLPIDLLQPLMAGALDRIHASGACLAGGHSIENDALILGFSIAGFVAKNRAWTNAGAKPGDALILTKGLGTGTITSGLKSGKSEPDWVASAIQSMITLNDCPELLSNIDIHAATDVTGFGLCGHALHIAQASQVSLCFQTSRLPAIQGARTCLERGVLNRAHHTNRAYTEKHVSWGETAEIDQWLTLDPQTSGGLLLAVAQDQVAETLNLLGPRFPSACQVGRVLAASDTELIFEA